MVRTGKSKVIVYKAIQDDGTSYWPEKFPIKVLKNWETELGPVFFPSQYQSSPVNMYGKFLKTEWIHYYSERPDSFEKIVAFVDPAVSQSEKANYFAIAVGGLFSNQVYLLDLVRTRVPLHSQLKIIIDLQSIWNINEWIVEVTGQQAYLAQHIKENTLLNVVEQRPKSSKDVKFATGAAHFNARKSLIPGFKNELGQWCASDKFQVFVEEWQNFPDYPTDDTIDAIIGVIDSLVTGVIPESVNEPDNLADAIKLFNNDLSSEQRKILEEYYAGDFNILSIRKSGLYNGMR